MKPADLLVEIGTEELPPKALRALMDAFAANLGRALDDARLAHGELHAYASPRRLAVLVESLARGQEDRHTSQKGPPVSVAFDDTGQALPPATAFAKKCGVGVADLGRIKTDKGEWLTADTTETGRSAAELLPDLIERALAELPIPRRMRWGAGEAEFVRPVHWVVLLHGGKVIEGSVMGVPAGKKSMGHRFHSKGPITISKVADYLDTLKEKGHVIADFATRRDLVKNGVEKLAKKAKGAIVDGELLYGRSRRTGRVARTVARQLRRGVSTIAARGRRVYPHRASALLSGRRFFRQPVAKVRHGREPRKRRA